MAFDPSGCAAPALAAQGREVSVIDAFGAGDDMMRFVTSELGARGVIKGAPYSAIAVNEARQVLNDGNHIERSLSIRLYRDSQGRTRQEQPGGAVFINDVVAGKGYVLNTQRKSARAQNFAARAHPAGASRASSSAGRSGPTAASVVEAALANECGGSALMGGRHAALGARARRTDAGRAR